MATLAGFPYFEIQFTKEGIVFQPEEVTDLINLLSESQITDLLVLSHGWNNDMEEARSLYQRLGTLFAAEIAKRPELVERKFAIAAVLWPSKKFAEEDLIAGGGAASLTTAAPTDVLINQLRELQNFFDGDESTAIVQQAIDKVDQFGADLNAPRKYVALIQQLIAKASPEKEGEPEDFSASHVNKNDPTDLLNRLSDVRLANSTDFIGDSTGLSGSSTTTDFNAGGGAGGLFDLSGLTNGARNLLNFATYYQMKDRAGKVGVLGLNPILKRIKQTLPNCKLHLIGHSFGARVVTAATAGPDTISTVPIDTLSLLQAAFSHYGFAENYEDGKDGFFRSVLTQRKVKGPILISQTHNDKAVGVAYAIASRIAGQIGAFLGDPNDLFGGLGANGAQKTPASSTQFNLDFGSVYSFQINTLYNLNADNCIMDHSDICHPQVANAIVSSIAT
ncbi:hypothetical protein ACFPMF_16135 [Larkinella bovis]|uniref:Alpha/beta hydrolase n=1 Tax=Larkinella bovis TaxID=683041 RepID=A0ABW0IEM6_9BACT